MQLSQDVFESFCAELAERSPGYIHAVLKGEKEGIDSSVFNQPPEEFVTQHLVWPICDSLGYAYTTEQYLKGHGGFIDAYISNTPEPILCECKPLNQYKRAISDLRDYLSHPEIATAYGIATDGINWLLIREPGDLRRNPVIIEYHSFRNAMLDYFLTEGYLDRQMEGERVLWNSSIGNVTEVPYSKSNHLKRIDLGESSKDFTKKFTARSIAATIAAEK